MPGIQEIAERAGVSPATVSRALRGLHHVNPQTRSRILEAAEELGYQSRSATSQIGEVENVGVVTPHISRWFFSSVIEGVAQGLRNAQMDLLLYTFTNIDGRSRIFNDTQAHKRIEGMIVVTMPLQEDELTEIKAWGLPVVLLGTRHEGFSSVHIDDVEGARVATQHLIDLGHRKIAIMSGGPQNAYSFPVHQYRKEGFLKALGDASIEFNPRFEIYADFTVKTARDSMRDLLNRNELPTAIFCESDEMAFGAMQAIADAGLKCPDDISVIGFDNHNFAEYLGLTTVAQPVHLQGEMAVLLLLERLNNPDTPVKQLLIPTNLIVRNSTKALGV